MLGKKQAIGLAAALILSACSGSGSGGTSTIPPGGYNGSCDPGTAVSLANPTPNSFNVSSTIGSIKIVASGNNNTLGSTYGSWSLFLQSNGFGSVNSGNLSLVPGNGAPAPYQSDFYYQAGIPQLQQGTTYSVYLANGGCNGVMIGSFST